MKRIIQIAALFLAFIAPGVVQAQDRATTLRVVVHANLQILDPVWTTAFITNRHGYLIYDTLYGMNSRFEPQPQMAEGHEVLEDGLLYRIRLREGLRFHDGSPVRAQDAVASLRRWMTRDAMGQRMGSVTSGIEAVDERTFEIRLRERWGLVIETLGKASNPAFIMPERIANTPSSTQVTETIGSGPFIFVRDEWRPGNRVVYRRNPDYVPRAEPADYMSGGKRPLMERIEWLYIPDQNTALAALNAGEIDYYEAPPLDFITSLERNRNVRIVNIDTLGTQGLIRPNHLSPPFNDPRARQALAHLVRQEDYMRVVVGNPRLYQRFCGAFFQCGSANDTAVGSEPYQQPNIERARELLREAGYNGERIVVMQPTDRPQYNAATAVLIQSLRRAGVNVDVQAMDWSTLLSRRANRSPPDQGGYHLFITTHGGPDTAAPVSNTWFNSRCERANPGWACDMELDGMVAEWARESDPAARRPILERIHRRAWETLPYIPFGQYTQPIAVRSNVHGIVAAGLPVYWNIEKR
ncbi:MAG: transporter substrate-binding protein [Rhodospirillales bacterium]|nr:transporter substrate-binding protein [Rhodospirillales bacterium]